MCVPLANAPPPPSLLSYVIITTMSNRNLPWAEPKGSVRTEKWSTIKTSYLIKYFSERCRIANGVQWLQSFQFGGEPVRDYFSCAALISYRIFSLIYKKNRFFYILPLLFISLDVNYGKDMKESSTWHLPICLTLFCRLGLYKLWWRSFPSE